MRKRLLPNRSPLQSRLQRLRKLKNVLRVRLSCCSLTLSGAFSPIGSSGDYKFPFDWGFSFAGIIRHCLAEDFKSKKNLKWFEAWWHSNAIARTSIHIKSATRNICRDFGRQPQITLFAASHYKCPLSDASYCFH